MKKAKIFGRSIPVLAIVAIAASAGLVSAALLSYYGKITATVDVHQSVVVDGQNYLNPIEESIDTIGGNTVVTTHSLTNRSEVPATVNLVNSCLAVDREDNPMDCKGVTVTYLEPLGYSETMNPTAGSIPADITVEDLGDKVRWTIDMDETATAFDSGHHAALGMAIAVGNEVKYAIHSNDGVCSAQPFGTWLYSPYDGVSFDWCGGSKVADLGWMSATGERDLGTNTEAKFTVTINKEKLDMQEFKWTMRLFGSTCDTYVGTDDFTATDYFNTVKLASEITDGITLEPGETTDFHIRYSFDIGIVPGTYTITTTVEPVV